MVTIRLMNFELFIQTHTEPVKGLFKINTSGKGELFINLGCTEVILTDHSKVQAYFKNERFPQNETHNGEGGASSTN